MSGAEPPRLHPAGFPAVLVLLAVGVGWLFWPLFVDGGLLGAPRTDVLRAVWGLDHQWRGLPIPFWTDRIGFPAGVKVVVLPFISSLLGAPLVPLFGAVAAYDTWMVALSWASAAATAWFVRERTRSDAAGLLAGATLLAQPMLWLALTDGTAEFVAFWSVPLTLGLVARLRRAPRAAWTVGLALAVVALDSPYHAVFLVPLLLPLVRPLPREAWRPLAAGLFGGAAVVGGLYWGIPVGAPEARVSANAVSLRVWEQWEQGGARGWDYTLGAGFIPAGIVAGGLALALLRPIRALPWVLVGALMLAWALSAHPDNAFTLAKWLGAPGATLGESVIWLNTHLAPPVVRFPRRWLVPVALALGTAAGIGLTRLPGEALRWAFAVPLSAGALILAEARTSFRAELPRFEPPRPAFAAFVAEHPREGAVLYLPRVRGAAAVADRRDVLPVFAEVSPALVSADLIWFQVLTGRASVFRPDGLRTLTPRYAFGTEVEKLLQDLDDLANPQTTGRPIPPSATREPQRRAAAARMLAGAGLGFVVVDTRTMGEEGTRLARLPFAERIAEERSFDDGTGVTVWVLAEDPP